MNTDCIYTDGESVDTKPLILNIEDISKVSLINAKKDYILGVLMKNGDTYNIRISEISDVDGLDLSNFIQQLERGIEIANTPQEMAAITDLTKNEVIGIMPADSREKVLNWYGIETEDISQDIFVSKDEKYKVTFISKM